MAFKGLRRLLECFLQKNYLLTEEVACIEDCQESQDYQYIQDCKDSWNLLYISDYKGSWASNNHLALVNPLEKQCLTLHSLRPHGQIDD